MLTKEEMRSKALRRFALSISILNLLGHTVLGFEQSLACVGVALATSYGLEVLFETVGAMAEGRRPAYLAGGAATVDFFLPSHITALGTSMLMYPNAELWPIAFAVGVGIGSKYVFRIPGARGTCHFLNPSNTGMAVTLVVFPWITLAAATQFTKMTRGGWDWLIPCLVLCFGSLLNGKLTKRMPTIAGWVSGFVLQAFARFLVNGEQLRGLLLPATGVAFLLFTFYMITDPGTTPSATRPQLAFGLSVGLLYGVVTMLHVPFGFIFALMAVCTVRGAYIYAASKVAESVPSVAREASGVPSPEAGVSG